ncbi:TLK protein kinase [Salpingoeca rosetta]|uniref:TLK protein kinase n=1 Tax=Salpingoeca rosetta (strain ATCC 50818 / BSB-021) TaxID=946362 RepID=F2U9H1_SALR5|nr:TLK protein kinase [Salpingoeca rosetta]EGD72998.1 TLK protein kinase [Salpingoeca rosetta]|eukprot:XP_004994029.1 TLK protein kinase [Salpingoeca rosetta]
MDTSEVLHHSNPGNPQPPLHADPDRLRRLDRRIQNNGSRSQGVSQDGFDPPALGTGPPATGTASSDNNMQAPVPSKGLHMSTSHPVDLLQSSPQQQPEQPQPQQYHQQQQRQPPSRRTSVSADSPISSMYPRASGPSPSTTSTDSDDLQRPKQPKLSTSSQASLMGLGSIATANGEQLQATSASSSSTQPRTSTAKQRQSGSPPARARKARAASKRRGNSAASRTENARKALTNYVYSLPLDTCRSRLLALEQEKEETRRTHTEEVTQLQSTLESLRSKYRNTIVDLIMAQAQQENRRARDQHLLNVQRLGWATAVRSGLSVHEAWCDGSAFKSLYTRQREIEARRKQLDEDKKRLQKLRPSKSKRPPRKSPEGTSSEDVGGRGSSSRGSKDKPKLTEEEYQERLEVIALNLSNLKSEEESLKTQLAALIRERNLHVREMKRIADEDSARFRGLPYRLHERYVLMSLLGKGGFSEVYKAYDVDNCRMVACKIHQLNPTWSDAKKANYIKHATREYEIHKDLKHPRVVELYDVFEIDANSFCTVLEYCPGQDLDFLLKQEHRLTEREARNKIIQILNALKYLNSVEPPVIHYDLKPANVLLTDGQVKITDFGLSKQAKDIDESGNMDLTSQGAGTYWYLPPECFVVGTTPPKISSKVDVWSVGVIFYQCLYGEKPFGHNQSQQSILQNHTILRAHEVKFPDKPKVSEEAKAFIRRCLTYKAELRPDVKSLAEDIYLHRKPARMT